MPASSPDDSSRVDEKKLELVAAISRLVAPIDATLKNQETLMALLEANGRRQKKLLNLMRFVALLVLLGALGITASIYVQHQRGVDAGRRASAADVRMGTQERAIQDVLTEVAKSLVEMKALSKKVDDQPQVDIVADDTAPAGSPRAKVVIRPRKKTPDAGTPPPAPKPQATLELPVQLPPGSKLAKPPKKE